MTNRCPLCESRLAHNKYKDIIVLEDYYFSVNLTACHECGWVDNESTWVE